MAGRLATSAAATGLQPSQPLSSGASSSSTTKKISFSFGSKKNCEPATHGKSSFVGASSLTSARSSTGPTRVSSCPLASRNASLPGTSTASSIRVAAGSREVLSIFCGHDDSGGDGASKAATTHQVLSFDKYSGWEKKVEDKSVEEKQKAPFIIPCPHPLKRLDRHVAVNREELTAKASAAVPSTSASEGALAGRDEAVTIAAAAGAEKAKAVLAEAAGAAVSCIGETAARGSEPVQENCAAVTVTNGKEGAREPRIGDAEEKDGEMGGVKTAGVVEVAAGRPYHEDSDSPEPVSREQGGAAVATAQHKAGGQVVPVQSSIERKKGLVQYGLIKRCGAAAGGTPQNGSNVVANGGRETRAPSDTGIHYETASSLCAGLSPAAKGEVAKTANAAAITNENTGDADDLVAQAIIAEAKGDYARAAAAAWDSTRSPGERVPILARNAQLAAIRRRFRERLQSQQQSQIQQQLPKSEQLVPHDVTQEPQRQHRGRGAVFFGTPDVFIGQIDSSGERNPDDRNTTGRGSGKGLNAGTRGHTGSSNSGDVGTTSRSNATADIARENPGASPVVARGVLTLSRADDDRGGGKDVAFSGIVAGDRNNTLKLQQQQLFSRAEAEKELLRQELDLLPDAPPAYSAAYNAVPVSEFGLAMLRGMGYDPGVAAAKTAAVEEEKKDVKRRQYTRAGLGSEVEVDRLWAEREKQLKEEAMTEKKRKLENMQNSRYHR